MRPIDHVSIFKDISYDEFRKSAAEFFRALHRKEDPFTTEQLNNGYKCLGLLYMGHAEDWTDLEEHQAVIILEAATKRCIEAEAKNLH